VGLFFENPMIPQHLGPSAFAVSVIGRGNGRRRWSHINYSKRAMALDQVEVMEKLGFRQFALVSHDRGSRVAHRLTLDHPDRVTKLVMMDICPTHYMYKTADREMASAYYHWLTSRGRSLPWRNASTDPEGNTPAAVPMPAARSSI
jgi:pimeloyl-ACP methyl ester carboxylesterase